MTDVEWCDRLQPEGIDRGTAIRWRFRFLSLLRPLKTVDAKIAARAAHTAARLSDIYAGSPEEQP